MEKFIIIINCTNDQLKTILNDWLVLYVNQLNSKSVFEFAEIKPNRFILKIDKSIGDTLFFFLVNYLAFPIGFKKTFEVAGYTTASKHKKFLNKKIYVFNNLQQTEFDNVWITTEYNETYKFDFGGGLKKISDNNFKYVKPNIEDKPISYEQIIFNKKELLEEIKIKEEEKKKRNLEKRFKIISIILFIGMPIAFLIKQIIQTPDFEFWLIPSFLMAISFWFVMDYKIFHNIRRVLICVLLSLLFFVFVVNTKDIFFITVATIPLSSIIVMLLATKLLGTKLDYIVNKLDRGFWLIMFALSVLISVFVFNPILKYLMKF